MQYKKIMTFFLVALPLSVVIRFIQLWFTVETTTGFFKHGFEAFGNYMLVLIFAVALVSAIFGFFTRRSYENPPEGSIFTAIAALGYAISIVCEIFTESSTALSILPWQTGLLKITGILSAVFFIAFALQTFIDFPLPEICTAAPMLYLIMRIICDFTAISSLAMISDNLILMGAYCSGLWFMLQFAKLYNKADAKHNSKKLLAGGLAAVILCFTQSLPHIFINIFSGYSYLHTTYAANFNVLLMGIFILVFLISHFKNREHYDSAN